MLIKDTTMKDASAAFTQVVNSDIDDLTIVVNLTTLMENTRLRPDEVL